MGLECTITKTIDVVPDTSKMRWEGMIVMLKLSTR